MASLPAELERSSLKGPGPIDLFDGSLHIPANIHTHEGFRKWALSDEFPEKLRVFFWRGEVWLDMSKEEIRTHAAVKTEYARVLTNLNEEMDVGNFYINGVLITNKEAKVSNNPDMVAVFWESLEAGRVRYETRKNREMEIVGSPDWVLEIVSESSVTKDFKQLREAYHQAKVPEYWLVDARKEEIDFRIWVWKPRGYQAVKVQEGWLRSAVFGRSFRLQRTRDRRGAWRYRLESKLY